MGAKNMSWKISGSREKKLILKEKSIYIYIHSAAAFVFNLMFDQLTVHTEVKHSPGM